MPHLAVRSNCCSDGLACIIRMIVQIALSVWKLLKWIFVAVQQTNQLTTFDDISEQHEDHVEEHHFNTTCDDEECHDVLSSDTFFNSNLSPPWYTQKLIDQEAHAQHNNNDDIAITNRHRHCFKSPRRDDDDRENIDHLKRILSQFTFP